MPAPFCFDKENRLIFTGRVFGHSLTHETLWHVLAGFGTAPAPLQQLYFDIGKWLSTYHVAMATPQRVPFTDVTDKLKAALKCDVHFQAGEKDILLGHLDVIQQEGVYRNYVMTLTRPHNDFCLRNIIIRKDRCFTVTDWDAAIHPQFPQTAPIWHDLTTFMINVESLLRFHPLVSPGKTNALARSFLTGYFSEAALDVTPMIDGILWVFVLHRYIGLIGDRPLYEIYRKRLAFRFVGLLRKRLLRGTRSFAEQYVPS